MMGKYDDDAMGGLSKVMLVLWFVGCDPLDHEVKKP